MNIYRKEQHEISDACHVFLLQRGAYKKLLPYQQIVPITPPNYTDLDLHHGIDAHIGTEAGSSCIQYRFRDIQYKKYQDFTITPREWEVIKAEWFIYGYYIEKSGEYQVVQAVSVLVSELKRHEQHVLDSGSKIKMRKDLIDNQYFFTIPFRHLQGVKEWKI